jgi:hypothetical protein
MNIGINSLTSGSINMPQRDSSFTYVSLAPYAGIERQLERIANALEKIADDGSKECSICHRMTHFYSDMPYGCDWDTQIICSDCLQRALEKLTSQS